MRSALIALAFVLGISVAVPQSTTSPPTRPGEAGEAEGSIRDMVYVPGGKFVMGMTERQAAGLAREHGVSKDWFTAWVPQREADVKPFYIDRYEVTNRQYLEFVKATGYGPPEIPSWRGMEYAEGEDDFPVTGVSHPDAEGYAKWAGKRLPTEEEWEKAARGTDGRAYVWGNTWKAGACRMDQAVRGGDSYGPAAVGSHPQDRSPYGVMDMAGNALEWTSDFIGNWPVLRGGCYAQSQPYSFLCPARVAQPPTNGPVAYLGLRCAMDAPVAPPAEEGAAVAPRKMSSRKLPTPRPELYLKEPIRFYSIPGNFSRVLFAVPFLPGNNFGVLVMEGMGVHGEDLTYSEDHTVATIHHPSPRSTLVYDLELRGKLDHADIEYRIKNTGDEPVTATFSSCFNLNHTPNFQDHEGMRTFMLTDRGFERIGGLPRQLQSGQPGIMRQRYPASMFRAPFLALVSRDGEWVVSETAEEAETIFTNLEYSCQHSDRSVSLGPGEETVARHRFYFLRGTPKDLLRRWKQDFGAE